jgi:hypothetical protein
MPQVGFEPTVSVLEWWAKTVHALDRAETVVSILKYHRVNFSKQTTAATLHRNSAIHDQLPIAFDSVQPLK